MKPSKILSSRGEEKFAKMVREIRGEERRILLSKFQLQKIGKRLRYISGPPTFTEDRRSENRRQKAVVLR